MKQMKTRNFLWTLPLAAVTLVMAACSNDEIIDGESQLGETVKMTFTAGAPQTRTILLPGGPGTDWRGVEWQLGDAISVFDKNNANNRFGNYDEGDLGKFSGTAVESDSYIAVYPYNKQMVCNGKTVSGLSLPSTQEAVAGTFAQNLSLAWAQTTSDYMFLEFHHLCAVVKFSIFGQEAEQVETVTLTDNAQKPLGYDKFDIVIQGEGENEQASLNERGESFSSIVLNAPNGGFVSGSDYYFVILPDKEQAENAPFQSGLTLSFKMKDESTIEKSTNKAIDLNVGEIANLGSISLEEKKITNKDLIHALEQSALYPTVFDKDENGFVPITGKNKEIIIETKSLKFTYPKTLTDLSGIECFSNLESLFCSELNLVSLDVSSLKKLKQLDCSGNRSLTDLNVSGLTNLETLECSSTGLTLLDVIGLENLQKLSCDQSSFLETLKFGENDKLTELWCSECNLSSLDVSSFTALEKLDCSYNQNLTSLTLGNLAALTYLSCYNCQLSKLDVSGLTKLSDLSCAENKLSELDLRKNENLTSLYCGEQVGCDDDNKMRLYLPESLVDMWNNDWKSSSRYVELVTE